MCYLSIPVVYQFIKALNMPISWTKDVNLNAYYAIGELTLLSPMLCSVVTQPSHAVFGIISEQVTLTTNSIDIRSHFSAASTHVLFTM